MKNFKIVARISLALSTLTATATLLAYALGLIPDQRKLELATRAKFTEALAVQLVSAASHNDFTVINSTIKSVVDRNDQVNSIAVKRADGTSLAMTSDHQKFWTANENKPSTPTQVTVPIMDGPKKWGSVEIALTPLPASYNIFGVSALIFGFMGFIFIAGFIGNFLVLRRTLKSLDPSKAVPDRVQKAFNSLSEGVVVVDKEGSILLANSAFSNDAGMEADSMLGLPLDQLSWIAQSEEPVEFPWVRSIGGDSHSIEARMSLTSPSGNRINYTTNSSQVTDPEGKIVGAIITFDNVTDLEYKNAELNLMVSELQKKDREIRLKNRELHILATRDPLTNCLNRRAFFEGYNERLEETRENPTSVFCMMVDLDKFKRVNDTYGHPVGDEVIKMMGNILKSIANTGDVVGRYGGEEFCVIRFGYTIEENLAIAEKIRTTIIEHSTQIEILNEPITTSIGAASTIGSQIAPSDLIDRADKALYAAKTGGRDQVVQWEELSDTSSIDNNVNGLKHTDHAQYEKTPEELQETMRNALRNNELCLYFQPILDLDTCRVNSMEVLLRFEGEDLRGNSVEKLIAIAEQSGQIIEIGHWVMETAIAQYQKWTNSMGEQPNMAINLSTRQIADHQASENILRLIKNKMKDPTKLEIEITESAIIKDMEEAKIFLQKLRNLGVRIVLDDFGTGYSSLKYIGEFHPDCIKMDQYFMKNIADDGSDQRLVAAIINMAKNLNIEIVAEGIETTTQLENVMQMQCDLGQGYLFSKPMPANIMPEWLALFSNDDQFPVDLPDRKMVG